MYKQFGMLALTNVLLLSQPASALIFQLDFSATATQIEGNSLGYDIGDTVTSSFFIDTEADITSEFDGSEGIEWPATPRLVANSSMGPDRHTDNHNFIESDFIIPGDSPNDAIYVGNDTAPPFWMWFPLPENQPADYFLVGDGISSVEQKSDGSSISTARFTNIFIGTEDLSWIDSFAYEDFDFYIDDTEFLSPYSSFRISEHYSHSNPPYYDANGNFIVDTIEERDDITTFSLDRVRFRKVSEVPEPAPLALTLLAGLFLLIRKKIS